MSVLVWSANSHQACGTIGVIWSEVVDIVEMVKVAPIHLTTLDGDKVAAGIVGAWEGEKEKSVISKHYDWVDREMEGCVDE